MKANELRGQSASELTGLLAEQRARLAELKYNHSLSPVENPARMKALRKDIARILTVLAQTPTPQPN
jgi:large subunit ribosomal protein L29